MSIEEFLAARDIAKGLVTTNIKILKDILVVADGQFIFDKIDNDMAKEAYRKLNIAYYQFDDMHERHLYHALSLKRFEEECRENKNDLAYLEFEDKTIEKVQLYAEDVDKEVSKLDRAYTKYTKTLATSVDNKKKDDEAKAEDAAREMEIVLLADAMEINRTRFEDNSIKYPVDVENAI